MEFLVLGVLILAYIIGIYNNNNKLDSGNVIRLIAVAFVMLCTASLYVLLEGLK